MRGVFDDVVQQQLNRPVLFRLAGFQVHQRIGEAVPAADGVEQRQRRQRGQGQRQIHRHQRTDRACAVDLRRLAKAVRHAVEERAQHDDVEHADAVRQNQRPRGVEHLEVVQQDVARNRAGTEVHREQDDEVDDLAAAQIFVNQREGGADGQHKAQHRADDGQDARPRQRPCVLAVAQNGLVRLKIPALGPEEHVVANQVFAGGQGACQHVDHRQQANHHRQKDDEGNDEVAHAGLLGFDHALMDFFAVEGSCRRHIAASLHDARLVELLRQRVRGKQEDDADDGLEQTDRCGQGELVALDAALVDEDGNRLACALNQRVAQGERTVELAAEDAAKVHNQQDDDGGADARQGDVPDFAQAARAVHFRRFVQLRADAGQRGEVDNGVPAAFLPDAQHDVGCAPVVLRA